jgi:glycine cleavage system aminomethyltransferase T/glycine/D-amino acid oxidase-like deaminating enzyme
MERLPESAKVVIVGQGGIVGASVAHHLVEMGWDDIVGIDKASIPTDIGSTSHASDFCFSTSHDKLTCFTTTYSQRFYAKRGRYLKKGGLEVARVGDDERMEELKRKVGSGKAFGTNVRLISPGEAKERFPLVNAEAIQGAMWDPDAGLVVPRSQLVAGELVDENVAKGALRVFPNTPATGFEVDQARIRGVHTPKGFIEAPIVLICTGIWGPVVGDLAGVRIPLMPIEHPLLFFGPMDTLRDAGEEMVYPLFRDQGNSAYVRDTGDPKTSEGGMLEWGYYEESHPRLVEARDIKEEGAGRMSPSMHELQLDQVLEQFERGCEVVPLFQELGWNEKASFNGLLSVTPDGGSILGESPEVRGLWLGEAVWIKDGPGVGRLLAEWMTRGMPHMDPHGGDVARFYPVQKRPDVVRARCYETGQKIYNPPVHPREPYLNARDLRRSPFHAREVDLGGYFMEVAGWERAHGYAANETRLAEYLARVPEREAEWDARHFWRVSNAEHLAMSDHCGMINLSHFAIYDVKGPGAEGLLEYLSVAKVGGTTPAGKGIYTHFLDPYGGIRGDLTITRTADDRYRVVCGGDTGHRDYVWMRGARDALGFDAEIEDVSDALATIGLWGPKAREVLGRVVEDPDEITDENLPFARSRRLWIRGAPVWAFRISYVGEYGWELYAPMSYGLALWDALFDAGAIPVGIETYANSRRLEKSLRLQNTDLETEYNLYEAGLARPKVKTADFLGKSAYLEQRERPHQPAYLCTMTMDDHVDASGRRRYPVGHWPLLSPETEEVLIDEVGRRSYVTSAAYGPSVGKVILMGYVPHAQAVEGEALVLEYFGEHYPVTIEAVGYRALYDPDNTRLKG